MLILFLFYCHFVLPDYLPVVGETSFNRDEVIATYFNLGFPTVKVLAFLSWCGSKLTITLRSTQIKTAVQKKELFSCAGGC